MGLRAAFLLVLPVLAAGGPAAGAGTPAPSPYVGMESRRIAAVPPER